MSVLLWGSEEGKGGGDKGGGDVTEINWDVKSFLLLVVEFVFLSLKCAYKKESRSDQIALLLKKMLQ